MEEQKLKRVVCVLNHKGGVGKTTTVQNIAAGLLERNKKMKILMIDLDPQCNLSLLSGYDLTSDGRTVYDALRESSGLPIYITNNKMYICPASPKLQNIDPDLSNKVRPREVLLSCISKKIDNLTGKDLPEYAMDAFDYIIVDCPPAFSLTTYNAMSITDGLLVPVQMESLSINGLSTIMVKMNEMSEINPDICLMGIVPVMMDKRLAIAKGILDYLRKKYGKDVTQTIIHSCVKIKESHNSLQDIFTYDKSCVAAFEYSRLVKELFK